MKKLLYSRMDPELASRGISYINNQMQHAVLTSVSPVQRESVITCPPLTYSNKVILAPMVRIGTLPMRLLALQYGADIVYCEEIIDQKLLKCTRIQNEILGTVDYVMSDGTTVFRTHPSERGKVVFQMGTADPVKAVEVAKMIEGDVAGIDVNMGCPKDYSTKGGMGAALLSEPERIKQILTELVKSVSKPVTCKIRLLPTLEASLSLVRMIEGCGVSAIAIHGRRREERPKHPNHNDQIRELAQAVGIPVIANGGSQDFHSFSDLLSFCEECACSSVMVARAAQWNPSIFNKEGILPLQQVITDYLKIATQYSRHVSNVKYVIQTMLHEQQKTETVTKLHSAHTIKDICAIWNLTAYYESVMQKQADIINHLSTVQQQPAAAKRKRLDDGTEITCMPLIYNKYAYKDTTPKQVLNEHLRKVNKIPVYTTMQQADKTFHCVVTYDNMKFSSTFCDKVKRNAEQAAASVCLKYLGVDDGRLRVEGEAGEAGEGAAAHGSEHHAPLTIITPEQISHVGLDLRTKRPRLSPEADVSKQRQQKFIASATTANTTQANIDVRDSNASIATTGGNVATSRYNVNMHPLSVAASHTQPVVTHTQPLSTATNHTQSLSIAVHHTHSHTTSANHTLPKATAEYNTQPPATTAYSTHFLSKPENNARVLATASYRTQSSNSQVTSTTTQPAARTSAAPHSLADLPDGIPIDILQELMVNVPAINVMIQALGGFESLHKLFMSPHVTDAATALSACFHRLGGMAGLEKLLGGAEAVREMQQSLGSHGGLLSVLAAAAAAAKQSTTGTNTKPKVDSVPHKVDRLHHHHHHQDTSRALIQVDSKATCPPTFTSLIDSMCEAQLREENNVETDHSSFISESNR